VAVVSVISFHFVFGLAMVLWQNYDNTQMGSARKAFCSCNIC